MRKKDLKASIDKAVKIRRTLQPLHEAFLPLLLVAVSSTAALLILIINKYIFPFGHTLLAPMLGHIIVLLVPTYIFLQITSYGTSPKALFDELGFHKIGADHIFFLVFSSLFMISTSFVMNTLFYGVYKASEGFNLLGIFTAGGEEYTVSLPYLIIVYALVPAIIEEFMLRGVIFTSLSKISSEIAIVGSALLSAILSFTIGGFPAAAFCALTYCFVRYITGSVISCMIVHFAFNLYGLFLQTNLSKYLVSQQNNLLLLTVTLSVWLICCALFFAECSHIFRTKSKRIHEGEEKSKIRGFDIKKLKNQGLSILSHVPSLVCAAVCVVMFIAVTVIGIINM